MTHYNYLIIGGGMTADAAIRGIRELDSTGSMGLISAETNPPYNRPPLSKGLWKEQSIAQIWRDTQDLEVELHLGRTVTSLDPQDRRAIDHRNTIYTFDKVLLATGGSPKRLPFDDVNDEIIYYRTLEDYKRLRALADERDRFAVIGGGFIGSEIAAALAMNDKEVVMIFPEAGIGGLVFPPDLSDFLTDYYRDKGIEVLAGDTIKAIEKRGDYLVLQTERQDDIIVDEVVAGIGIEPNTGLAEAAGLEVDDGIVVNRSLTTSHPDIFAAGDVAAFQNTALARRIRVEHEDNANTMGHLAGQAMAGKAVVYDYLPFFYSDLFDIGYEAVGIIDASLETIADWEEPYQKGLIYYVQDGQVEGVIMWNVWDQLDEARALIGKAGPFRAEDLKEQLPA